MITTRQLTEQLRKLVMLRQTLSEEPHDLDRIAIARLAEDADNAHHQVERDLELQFMEARAARLQSVHAAMDRLRDGLYGTCCDCDEEISMRRLEAIPWAARCLKCQETCESLRPDSDAQRLARAEYSILRSAPAVA